MSSSHLRDDWKELASREGDGLEISLQWSKSTDRVKVSVFDQRLEESFEIAIAGAQALSAFHHPFAFAASRGFGSVEVERDPIYLRQQV